MAGSAPVDSVVTGKAAIPTTKTANIEKRSIGAGTSFGRKIIVGSTPTFSTTTERVVLQT